MPAAVICVKWIVGVFKCREVSIVDLSRVTKNWFVVSCTYYHTRKEFPVKA